MARDSHKDPSDPGYAMKPLQMPPAWHTQASVTGQDGIEATSGLTQNYTTLGQRTGHSTTQDAGGSGSTAPFPPPLTGPVADAWQFFFETIGVPVDWPAPPTPPTTPPTGEPTTTTSTEETTTTTEEPTTTTTEESTTTTEESTTTTTEETTTTTEEPTTTTTEEEPPTTTTTEEPPTTTTTEGEPE